MVRWLSYFGTSSVARSRGSNLKYCAPYLSGTYHHTVEYNCSRNSGKYCCCDLPLPAQYIDDSWICNHLARLLNDGRRCGSNYTIQYFMQYFSRYVSPSFTLRGGAFPASPCRPSPITNLARRPGEPPSSSHRPADPEAPGVVRHFLAR
jgi:hypothetical protein